MNKLRQFIFGLVLFLLAVGFARAYVYSTHQSVWTPGTISMQIKLGSSVSLMDGTNYSTSVQAAMQTWNGFLGTVQFVPQIVAQSNVQADRVNDIYFNSTIEGEAFGSGVLAVTLIYTSPSVFEIVEADIIFNTAWTWNSYRGALQSPEDIRRVALHELGHVLGLSHPDERGQSVGALMNSIVSDLDGLTSDDIAGAQSVYRAPGQTYGPANDNFANATTISLSNGSIQVSGTSLYATKEPGEPDHDPGVGSGGASVWWKWTAPYGGSMAVTTQGSKFDTLLGVYTGGAVAALNLVGGNDDVQSGVVRYSAVTFAATAGVTYYFAVDGWNANSGPVVVNLNFSALIPPSIDSHPSNRSVLDGASAQFSGSASGTPAPTYRWQMREGGGDWRDLSDDGNFSGTSSPNLRITQATLALNGLLFRFSATNALGSVVSNPATLTVTASPPSIVTNPQSLEVPQGASATFTVTAMGTAPLTYQWYRSSGLIPGAITSSLQLTNADRDRDAMSYYVVVSNNQGSVNSNVAELRVVTPPRFTRQPANISVRRYASTSLNAEIAPTGGANTFQWKKDGVNIGSASTYSGTSSYYSITTAQPVYQGNYTLVVSNVAGSVTSDSAALEVLPVAAPDNISQTEVVYASPGNPVYLSIYSQMEWGTPLTYQWYKNGQPIAGANSASYQVANVTPAVMGEYFVSVTNSAGTGVSKTFNVTPTRSSPANYHWIDAKVFNHVAYFLYASAPRIARYDLLTRRWLADWPLAAAPTAFAITDGDVYVASGSLLTRYNPDFSNPTVLYSTSGTITGLLVKDQHLFIGSNNYPYAEYRSILRATGELVAQKTTTYGPTVGFSYSAAQDKLFAHTTMTTPSDIWSIQYFSNGQFGLAEDSTYHGDFGDARLTQVVANGSLVVEDDGVVYRTGDLRHVSSVGGYFHALLPSSDEGYYVLRGGIVAKLDDNFQETGRALFSQYATFLAEEAGVLFGFTQPSSAGGAVVVEELNPASILPPTKASHLNPVGRQIWSPQIFADKNGVISIYSRMDRQIYRWSANEARYLPSVVMSSTPNFVSYSEGNQSYYYDRYGYQLRRLLVENEEGKEQPLHTATLPLTGLQTAGRLLMFADRSGAWSSHSIINDMGELVTWRDWNYRSRQFEWCEATNRMFFFRDDTSPNDLHYEVVDMLGRITTVGETPYHGDVMTSLPIRAAADGSAVLLGSGEIYDGLSLSRVARLPGAVIDGIWLAGLLHTIRETSDGTEMQSWSVPGYSLLRSVRVEGVPLRVLEIPGGRLLLVTTQSGVLSFRYFSPATLAEINPSSFSGAPVIIQQPQSVAVKRGATAALAVAAQGSAALAYQWFKDDVAIPGATAASYVIVSTEVTDTGRYTVEVSNGVGRVLSAPANLDLVSAPVFTKLLAPQIVSIGSTVTLSVEVEVTGPVIYQWVKNGAILSQATGPSLSFGSVQTTDAGQYSVTVTGEGGSVTSPSVTLQVVDGPAITQHPQPRVVVLGGEVTFTVGVNSATAVSYQWLKNGTSIPGATASNYRIQTLTLDDLGDYAVQITNMAGSVTSYAATIELAKLPSITQPPVAKVAYTGTTVSFMVRATSNALQSYQWLKDSEPIPGATADTYTIVLVQAGDTGNYAVRITNMAGSVSSVPVGLTVKLSTVPVITEQPFSHAVGLKLTTDFRVAATGEPTPSYRWQRSAGGTGVWTDLTEDAMATYAGVTQAQLILLQNATLLVNQNDRFRCVVSNVAGTVTSAEAALTVTPTGAVLTATGGYNHAHLLQISGSASGTGRNGEGQVGDGTGVSRQSPVQMHTGVVQISAGSDHTLLVKQDGSLWATGYNEQGPLGTGNTTNAASPVQIAGGVAAAVGGHRHSLFRKMDGSLWAMGWNFYGQLGDGTTVDRQVPVHISTQVVELAAGFGHSLFVKSDGTLWAMGNNANGQFGNGTANASTHPIQVGAGILKVATGFYHTLMLRTDGALWASGYNGNGQLGAGSLSQRLTAEQVDTDVVAIAAGERHSVYLKADGTLWSMGDNSYGQLGDGTMVQRNTPVQIATGVVAVSVGLQFTQFVKADGGLWACGRNDQGQLGDGSTTNRMQPVLIASGGPGLPQAEVQPSATISDASDRVQLSWGAVLGAAYYEVWRSLSPERAGAVKIASRVVGSYYEDLSMVSGLHYYYWIKAVNAFGTRDQGAYAKGRAGSAPIMVAPAITMQPLANQTVSVGESASFSVMATGTAPLTYQWRRNGDDLLGATGTSYAVVHATVTDAGSYTVVVANGGGSITSQAGELTVNKQAQIIGFNAIDDRPYGPEPIILQATASSGLTVNFNVVSGPGFLSGNSLTLTGTGEIRVQASQAGNETYVVAVPVEQVFTVTPNLSSWQLNQFTSGELADTEISGAGADPDHDGLTNLVEYALGLNPKGSDTAGLPELKSTAMDWIYTFTKPVSVTDVTYVVERTVDLSNWTTNGVTVELVSSVEGVETWRATYPLGSGSTVFFRLKVSQ